MFKLVLYLIGLCVVLFTIHCFWRLQHGLLVTDI